MKFIWARCMQLSVLLLISVIVAASVEVSMTSFNEEIICDRCAHAIPNIVACFSNVE